MAKQPYVATRMERALSYPAVPAALVRLRCSRSLPVVVRGGGTVGHGANVLYRIQRRSTLRCVRELPFCFDLRSTGGLVAHGVAGWECKMAWARRKPFNIYECQSAYARLKGVYYRVGRVAVRSRD